MIVCLLVHYGLFSCLKKRRRKYNWGEHKEETKHFLLYFQYRNRRKSWGYNCFPFILFILLELGPIQTVECPRATGGEVGDTIKSSCFIYYFETWTDLNGWIPRKDGEELGVEFFFFIGDKIVLEWTKWWAILPRFTKAKQKWKTYSCILRRPMHQCRNEREKSVQNLSIEWGFKHLNNHEA